MITALWYLNSKETDYESDDGHEILSTSIQQSKSSINQPSADDLPSTSLMINQPSTSDQPSTNDQLSTSSVIHQPSTTDQPSTIILHQGWLHVSIGKNCGMYFYILTK